MPPSCGLPQSPRLCARATSAPFRIRSCSHAGAHAHTLRRGPQGRWGLQGGAELSCLGAEIIPGGDARVAPPLEVPPPMRPELDSAGCVSVLTVVVRALAPAHAHTEKRARARAPGAVVVGYRRTGLWKLAGGRGDGRGGRGDAVFRDDLEQHNEQWLLQPRRLGLGARAVLHGAYLVGTPAAPRPGAGRGLWAAGQGQSLGPRPCPVSFPVESVWAAPRSFQRGSRASPQRIRGTMCRALSGRRSCVPGLALSGTDGLNRGGGSYEAWGRPGAGITRL